ncbi:hypothetical protein HU200_007641 [Digitaria exilis]|uniref:Uncharacterized protein n=1 Tax=Digitaria exilis TaxID=1010633 RepID=A0A835FPM6_9POAL|nr:hypothetical protein HU200_007641 [Digitaria exilis]
MCHPGLPPIPPGCAAARRREQRQAGVLSPSPSAALPGPTHHYCVCSPTAHRGSFRCRWHRVGYEWRRRRPFAREGAGTTARTGAEEAMHQRMAAP